MPSSTDNTKTPDKGKSSKHEKALSKAKAKRVKRSKSLAFTNPSATPSMYQRIDTLLTEEI